MVDVSRNVVATLLVLVIVVSAVGTWHALSRSPVVPSQPAAGTSGQVLLTVSASDTVQPSSTQGTIQLEVGQ